MDRQQIAARLATNTARVLAHFAAPAAELERSYAPGKWKARAILAHVADVEFVNLWRFVKAVAEPDSVAGAFDENAWARTLGYETRPIDVSRDLFLGARKLLSHSLANLDDATLANASNHPEKGRLTGLRWCRLVIDHADHHLGQVEAARAGTQWKPQPVEEGWMFGAKASR